MQRFMLALHYHSHNNIFKWKFANAMPTILVAPFFGVPSGVYWYHHNAMHHVHENAALLDLSSTEHFKRDSVVDFVWYWLRFALLGPTELPLNMWKHRGMIDGLRVFSGCFVTFGVWIYLRENIHAQLADWIIAYPYLLASLLLMFGNWSQHIFVDPKDPRNDFKLTYTCVNSSENQKTFDDGYHVTHHIDSKLHWTKFARHFMRKENLEKYAKEDAFVFEGVHFFDVGLRILILRDLDYLAERYVVLPGQRKKRNKKEIVKEMKKRLVAIRN